MHPRMNCAAKAAEAVPGLAALASCLPRLPSPGDPLGIVHLCSVGELLVLPGRGQ